MDQGRFIASGADPGLRQIFESTAQRLAEIATYTRAAGQTMVDGAATPRTVVESDALRGAAARTTG